MSRAERSARNFANEALAELSKRYHDGIPIREIDVILVLWEFDATEAAIYCGRDGKSHEQVGPNTWLSLTWHKMEETGRYEITAYLS